jgi:hypothetical protein
MHIKTNTIVHLSIMGMLVLVGSLFSVLTVTSDPAAALSAKECREKYNSKQITGDLSKKFDKDKCAILLGGPCGGTASAGSGYFTCPDTATADAFCKKKYPSDAGKRNACRSGYFSTISGCSGVSSANKAACNEGKKEFDRLNKPDEDESDDTPPADDGISNPISGNGCAGVKTAFIKCNEKNTGPVEDNGIWALLMMVVNILTAGVGIVAVAGIVYGSILYTTAEDKADQVQKAISIIRNVVIGLVLFALMWAGLNFIVPGGVFS